MVVYEEIVDYNIAPVVYHYCSEKAFKNIIANKSLYLSDVTKGSDTSEFHRYIKYLYELQNRDKPHTKIHTSEFADFYNDHLYRCACFCKEGDILTQWERYADDARGLAIGFNTNELQKLLSGEYISTFRAFKPISYTNIKSNKIFERPDMKFVKCGVGMLQKGFFVKSLDYKPEMEYRFAVIFHRNILDTIKPYFICEDSFQRGDDKVEYFELNINHQELGLKIISCINIGPSCDLSIEQVKEYLLAHNYTYQIQVNKSGIPYKHVG